MNDTIKTLIAGAMIALVGAIAGGTLVSWTQNKEGVGGKFSASSYQPSASGGSSAQRMPPTGGPNQFRPPPPRPPGGTNSIFRPGGPGAWPSSPAEFQKAQELPEVKAAKEAFMEAQRKYVGLMQSAMGVKPEDRGKGPTIRGQMPEVSGQPPAASNQPAPSGTNGAVKGK